MQAERMTREIAGRLEAVDPSDARSWRKLAPCLGTEVWELNSPGLEAVWFSSEVTPLMIHRPGLRFVVGPAEALAIAKASA